MKVGLFVGCVLAAALPGVAIACKCEDPTLAEAVAQSKYVYIGTVMRSRMVKGGEFSHVESTLLVHRVGKGSISPGERVVTMGMTSCHLQLAVGHTYAVYENETGGVNGMCSGTGQIHRAKEEEFIRKVEDAAQKH